MTKYTYNDYDLFAYFYNKYWTIDYPEYMQLALEKLLFPYIKRSASILDLCCGTGNSTNELYKRGYTAIGIDGSLTMLSYANVNSPNTEFIHTDVREFNLDKKFDAAICLFDSVNHLMTISDVKLFFTNVHNHLKNDSLFVFDINSYESSINVNDASFSFVKDDEVIVNNAYFDDETEIITYNLTMFFKNAGIWSRGDAVIKEQFYPEELIVSTLYSTGFKNIRITNGFIDLNIPEFKERIFIVAWK